METKKEYLRKYYLLNKEKLLAQNKIRYEKNKKGHYLKCREYVAKNLDKVKAYKHQWYLDNIDFCKERSRINESKNRARVNLNHSIWKKKNRDKANRQMRNRHAVRKLTDTNYKLSFVLRARLRSAIKNGQKKGSAVKDLGCSITELKKYLESKFLEGMTWSNWGYKGWHIDHIKPVSSFDLSNRDEFLQAVHYTNLQPLWAKDNLLKGSKVLLFNKKGKHVC